MLQDSWYYRTPTGVKGPFTFDQLMTLYREETLSERSKIRHGVGGRWQLFSEAAQAREPEAAGANEAARRVLAEMDFAALHARGGERATVRSGARLFQSLGSLISGLGSGLGNLLEFAWGRVARFVSFRTVLTTALTVVAILLLKASPLLNTPLETAFVESEIIWREADALRRAGADQAEWDAFTQDALAKLEPIAADLQDAHENPPGIWGLIAGPDETTQEARHDLIQLTRNELPAALAAGPEGSSVHDGRVQLWLDRLREYMEGKNPYAVAEGSTSEEKPAGNWIPVIIGIDILLVCGVAVAWWRRQR